MKTVNNLSRWVSICGGLIVLTGLVHDGCVGIIMADRPWSGDYVWFFLTMGFALVFSGLLLMYAAAALRRFEDWGWNVALACGVFVGLLGVVGVALKEYGALILVVLALLELLPLFVYRHALAPPGLPIVE